MKSAISGACFCASAILAACATPEVGEAPEAMGDVVRGMGYTAVARPLEFWEPGAIIAVKSPIPFDGMLVCSPSGALGADFFPSVSETLSSSWRRATDRGISLGADVKAVNAKLGYNAVREISVLLSNAVVYEISDEEFFDALDDSQASSGCKQSIVARFEEGKPMSMIRSALKADVTYKITYDQGVDASLKYAHTQMIAVEIAGRAKANGEDTISGNQLIFGIMDDRLYLTKWAQATPGLPQLAASGVVSPDNRRLISSDLVINAVEADDGSSTK